MMVLDFDGSNLTFEGRHVATVPTISFLSKKEIVGSYVGVYTDDPAIYWLFMVEKSTTRGVNGKWLNCVDSTNREFEVIPEPADLAYKSIVRKSKTLKDFISFSLEKKGEYLQVPIQTHMTLLDELKKFL